jgi:hypothetical protein
MQQQDAFKGSPWNAKPSEDWNQPSYWHDYYQQLSQQPALRHKAVLAAVAGSLPRAVDTRRRPAAGERQRHRDSGRGGGTGRGVWLGALHAGVWPSADEQVCSWHVAYGMRWSWY